MDMILGADVFEEIHLHGSFKEEGLNFRNSSFGWIASGKQPNQKSFSLTTSLCIHKNFKSLPEKIFSRNNSHSQKPVSSINAFQPDAKPLVDTCVSATHRF